MTFKIRIYENIWISNEDIQTSVFNSLSIHIPRTLRTMAINTIFTDTETVSVENRMQEVLRRVINKYMFSCMYPT